MSDDEQPEAGVIAKIKSDFPSREIARIVMTAGEEEFIFVLTSPIREEWRKYRREITAAANDIEKIEDAIASAARAQIRWPARDEVKEVFERKPGIIQLFADELATLAGSHAEVVAKKL